MSANKSWPDLAEHLCRRLRVTVGTRVSVFVNDPSALPAAHALIAAVTRVGAQAQTVYTSEFADDIALRCSDIATLEQPAPLEAAAVEWADVHVSFRAMLWPTGDPEPSPEGPDRLAAQRRGKGVVSTLRWQKTRWCIVRIPTADWAARIGVPAEALLDEFFGGCLDDWDHARARWQPVADALTRASTVAISAPDTDLILDIRSGRGVVFAGEANLPDGEVATAPAATGVDGHIQFPGAFVFAGQVFEDLRLEFSGGVVTDVRANRGAEFARSLIDTDPGAHRVGELGIGLSERIRQWTGDLFLDEKILGTVHIALGRAYPECGGTNASTLHWDIVKDLRSIGGSVVIDDEAFIRNGRVQWNSLGADSGR